MATEIGSFFVIFLRMWYNLLPLPPCHPSAIQTSGRRSWGLNTTFHLSYMAQGMSTPQLYPRNLKSIWSEYYHFPNVCDADLSDPACPVRYMQDLVPVSH